MDHSRLVAVASSASSYSDNCLESALLFALFYPPSSSQSPNPFQELYINHDHHCSEAQNLLRERLELEVMFLHCPPHVFHTRDTFGLSAEIKNVSTALETLGHRLGASKFIRYRCNTLTKPPTTKETEVNVHQILLPSSVPSAPPSHQCLQCACTADLLQQSMEYQNLQFARPPHPALLINLSRSATRQFVRVPVIPSLNIQIQVLDDVHVHRHIYTLWAVLVLGMGSDGKYRSFVREAPVENSVTRSWSYFSPATTTTTTTTMSLEGKQTNSTVERLDCLEVLLESQEQIIKTGHGNSILEDKHLGHILYEADAYIYVPRTSSPPPPSTATGSHPQLEFGDDWNAKYGLGKGIQGHNNSCYLDVFLFALFYETRAFDSVLLADDRGAGTGTIVGQLVLDQLRLSIVPRLRSPPYRCDKEHLDPLRTILAHSNRKVSGEMMDIEEFINNLFTTVLELEPFIRYTIGTTNFLHQIIVGDVGESDPLNHTYARLDSLLQISFASQGLQFASTPSPALMIKMPRANGVLIGLNFILPTMNLVGKDLGLDRDFRLLAVICIRNRHYTAYVWRTEAHEWIYFNSMGPQGHPVVRQLPSLGHEIRSFEQRLYEMRPGSIVEARARPGPKLEDESKHLQRILQGSHLYIYVKG